MLGCLEVGKSRQNCKKLDELLATSVKSRKVLKHLLEALETSSILQLFMSYLQTNKEN